MTSAKVGTGKSMKFHVSLFLPGNLVGWMHGANAPLMRKMIKKHVKREKDVLNGRRKRNVKSLENAVPSIYPALLDHHDKSCSECVY